jgi:2-polyprenyl-3-methyl-5-hydroxy-6-metoxy-1,4-benzoquinol methylase
MTLDNAQQSQDLNEATRAIWDQNATFWDDKVRDGNDFQRILVAPTSERLLNLQAGEMVLEIACGSGVFSRRMAQLGVNVIATDFSTQFLERARARNTEHEDRITYHIVDVTHEEEVIALGKQRFDAAVCNMAIMDIAEIDPLMRSIRQVVRPGGRFVFSLLHPCFNHSGTTLCVEEIPLDDEILLTYSVKITKYLYSAPQKGIGILGQPAAHYYFNRPLHILLNSCFQAGLVLDGLEEPSFDYPHDGSQSERLLSWIHYHEIPPVLVVRLRIPN